MQLAEKFILLKGLKKGDAKMSLIMLSFPKNTGKNTKITEIKKKYVPSPLKTAVTSMGHLPIGDSLREI